MSRSGSKEQDANFLGRWSRRKSQAKADKPADAIPEAPVPEVSAHSTTQPSQSVPTDAPVTDEAALAPIPSLDSLDENSSYARFMASDVEKDLRRLALRKLFKAPVFGIRDGLDDYDDDFTSFEKLGNIVTADMKFHKERLEAEAAKEEEEQAQKLLARSDENAESESDRDTDTESDAGLDTTETEPPVIQSPDNQELADAADQPALVTLPQPIQRQPEAAPPVLAPRRQGLRLRVDTPDDKQDA